MPTITAERIAFYQSVLDTAIESGYSWFFYTSIERNADLEYVSAKLHEVDEFDDSRKFIEVVTWKTIQHGFSVLREMTVGIAPSIQRRLIADWKECDAGQFDVVDADNILQLAVLGELRYA